METIGQKTAILYCRVSSKEQIENTSLESQERSCREYAQRHDMQVLAVYVDKGESAKTADRTEFIKAIGFCTSKKNKVDYFVVFKLDRFARNQDDHVMVRAKLRQSGTELRSVTEPINDTPVGRAMEGMISVFAEFDNNVRTERTRSGMVERIKKGIWVWGAPLGFYRPSKGSNIVPDPEVAPLIRLAFDEYAKRTYSYQKLAELLAKKGFRTRQGKTPCAQLIEKTIKNPIYCGIIDIWGDRYQGNFEAIVSQELFDMCQEGYKGKARFSYRSQMNPSFPLRRLAVCAFCNRSITGSFSTGRMGGKYAYYHHHKQECPKAGFIPKETFEQNFVEYLVSITPDLDYERAFKSVVLDIWKNNYKNLDTDNEKIRREIVRLEQERQRVFDLHRAGTYSNEEFTEQKTIINRKITAQRCLIQDKQIEELNMEEVLNACFQFVRNTAAAWLQFEDEYEIRLRFQKFVFEQNIPFDGKKFGTANLAPIYRLNQEYGGSRETLVALTGKSWNRLLVDLSKWSEFTRDAGPFLIGLSEHNTLALVA